MEQPAFAAIRGAALTKPVHDSMNGISPVPRTAIVGCCQTIGDSRLL